MRLACLTHRRVSMIIECENCESRFNLDESFLNIGGSKVRCSICEHVFTAYPPEEVPIKEPATGEFLEEESFSLDSDALVGEEGAEPVKEEAHEALSLEQVPEKEKEIARKARAKAVKGKPEQVEEAVAATAKARRAGSRILPFILLIGLLILGGGAALYFFAPGLIPDSIPFLKSSKEQPTTDSGVARLSFKEVTGSFIRSNKAGHLFIIKGRVTNDYPKPRSFILIKGSILDDKGQPVKMKMVYAGNTFTETEIKTKPLVEIDEGLKNRFGKGRMNFNVKPGATLPFMVVLEDLPENISEFTVEAVRSTPGT
jgi:predicted Zn finger-like uncharacterized protein